MRSPRLASLLALVAACAPSHPAEGPATGSAAAPSPPILRTAPPAVPTPPEALLILAKRDERMAIVDPTTLKIIARVPVGHDPHEVVASPDGSLAYVSNYGHGAFHTLAVVDLTAQAPRPPIELGPLTGPHGLTYVAGKVWFTAEGAKVVGSLDPLKGTVDWVQGTGEDRTHMLIVSDDQKRIVTTNVASGTLSFLELDDHPRPPPGPPPGAAAHEGPHPPGPMGPPVPVWEQTRVTVGSGTEGFDLSPDGKEIWAADAQDGSIAIVDPSSKKLIQRLQANVKGANRLKFTRDGKWVFVSTLSGPDVVVFDAHTRSDAKRIPVGHGAAGILMQPDGSRAYVACSPDGYVAVIELRTLDVVGKIEAGNEPDGLAWAGKRR